MTSDAMSAPLGPDAAREMDARLVLEVAIANDGWALGDRSHAEIAEDMRAAILTYAAAVSSARDAEWRAAVRVVNERAFAGYAPVQMDNAQANAWADGVESALTALLARMGDK